MSEGRIDACAGGKRYEGGTAAPLRAADWLSLAAAPAFAAMALLTFLLGGPDPFCGSLRHSSPLTGMVPMYALMSAFHAAPWLRLVSGGPGGAGAGS